MTAQTTRQQAALMAKKAHYLALIAQIDEQLVALDLAETVQEVIADAPQTGTKSAGKTKNQRNGGEWIDERMINGCGPYYYRRWLENGKKRSEYLGKAKPN